MTAGETSAGVSRERSSSFYGGYMMFLLTSAFALNLLDRQILNVLAEPIKRDLLLADWQLGALTGLAFAVLHSVAALPIARWADRSDRVRIIGIAILAWSVFTAACGVAANFVQLLLLRVGVGVGEAGCQPPSQSLIMDHYPPERRSGALGKFGLGKPVGAAIGLAAGGLLAEAVGWRWTLVIAGAPGVVIGLLVLLTLKDPRRSVAAPALPPQLPLRVVLRDLVGRRSFVLFMLGMALLSFMSYGANAFAASFYLRVHGQDIARIGDAIGVGPLAVVGLGMGLIGATAGAIGSYLGGRLGDRWGARDLRAYAWIPAIGAALGCVSYIAMFTVPVGVLSLGLYMAPAFLNNVWNGPALLAVQSLAGARARATAVALVLFVASSLGMGLGPLTIGALSDTFAASMGEGEGLRLAIVIVAVVDLAAAACFWLASRTIRSDFQVVEASEASLAAAAPAR